MQPKSRKPADSQRNLEQLVSLATSSIWTAIVLVMLVILWGYQDAQAQWQQLEQDARMRVVLQSIPTPANIVASEATEGQPVTYVNTEMTPWAVAENGPQVLPETPLDSLTPALDGDGVDAPPQSPTPSPPPTIATATETQEPMPTSVSQQQPAATATRAPTPTPSSTPTHTPQPTSPPAAASSVTLPGAPDRLVIESVDIDTPVVPVRWTTVTRGDQDYSMWEVADYAAGWHMTSALPGQPGNTVLAGHHNINGEVFRFLVDVQEGDEVDLYVGPVIYRYTVEQKLIVKEKDEPLEVRQRNAQWIAPTDDVRLTLVTCWPYTNNTHRVIVVAKPAS